MKDVELHSIKSVKTEYLIYTRTIIFLLVAFMLSGLFTVFFLQDSCDRKERERCYRDLLTFNSRVAQNIPDGAVVFVGDSFIQGLCVAAVAPNAVNLGIGRDTTRGVLKRIDRYHTLQRAGTVVLLVGVNDLIQGFQDGLAKRYELILQAIPGHAPVVLTTVLPVDERVTQRVSNKDILSLNRDMGVVCARHESCHFKDLTENFVDSSGNLAIDYHIDDGIHLSPQGYSVWINEMENILADI